MKTTIRLGVLAALVAAGCDSNVNDSGAPFLVTDRVSLADDGGESDDLCLNASISGNGNRIAFQSNAMSLVPGDDGLFTDVFVRDVAAGRTFRISRSSTGGNPNGNCQFPVISADGQYVVFQSLALNLLGTPATTTGLYRTHVNTGVTERVNVNAGGGESVDGAPVGGAGSFSVSADGRYVAFLHNGTDLHGATTALVNVYRRDMTIPGNLAGDTVRISFSDAGGDPTAFPPGSGTVSYSSPSISGDGRFIAFSSNAIELVTPPKGNTLSDVYLWDATGPDIVRVSSAHPTLGGGFPSGDSSACRVSLDGSAVVFQSTANNIVLGDTSGTDVFHWTRATGTIVRCSVNSKGGQQVGGTSLSSGPSVSGDGQIVAFTSDTVNLFPEDFNNANDAIVRNLATGETFAASVATFGQHLEIGVTAGTVSVSADGRYVAFQSISSVLAGDDFNSVTDIYRRGPLR